MEHRISPKNIFTVYVRALGFYIFIPPFEFFTTQETRQQ